MGYIRHKRERKRTRAGQRDREQRERGRKKTREGERE